MTEEPDVEHNHGAVQLADRGGAGRTLQGHLRVRIRLLEDCHVSFFGRRVSTISNLPNVYKIIKKDEIRIYFPKK